MAKHGVTQTRQWDPIGLGLIHPSHDFHPAPPRMAKHGDADATWVPIRIGPIHPSQDFPVAPPSMTKRDELVWLCKK
jgi:hypothetical protein